jgi:hypothetical protein
MAKVLFKKFHGDTFVLPVTLTASGRPFNLTGTEIRFTMITDDEENPITETSEGYEITRDDENGYFEIVVDATVMELNFTAGSSYKFDVELTYSNGQKETLFVGTYKPKADITE